MMNKLVFIIPILVVLIGGAFFFNSRQNAPNPAVENNARTPTTNTTNQQTDSEAFSTPKKAAHYESNTPEHGTSLAGVPVNVVIDFNFDLAKGSEIKIEMKGKDFSTGETVIDEGKLAMRKKMDPSSPDGLYTVNYKACWADGSCHDGSFQFVIDRMTEEFVDMTGKKKVTVDLKDIAFSPKNIKISKGTEVTWVNQDSIEHTVNTNSHPAHTYFLSQNSRTLKKGDAYSVTFTETGIYPYHCTPHAASMKGAVLVE